MKKLLFLILLLSGSSKLFSQDFDVHQYRVEIFINEEGYFDVIEKYNLNFEMPKHGIYRDIQVSYDLKKEDGSSEKREIKLSKIEVPDREFDVSSRLEQKFSGNAQIKIGDADIYVEGQQYYEIRYRVENAFLFDDSNAQFYWNIKPSNWSAVFQKIDFVIHLPDGVSITENEAFVYSGGFGNTNPSNDFITSLSSTTFSGESKPGVYSNGGESVTVLLKLPKDSIQEFKPFWPFWTEYGWALILPLFYLAFYLIWKKHGEDDPVTTTTSYYPPKGMDPAMVGLLIDDSGDNSDLISLIPYWASKGHLKIEEIDKKGWLSKDDIKLTKLSPLEIDASPYEKEMFDGLFSKYSTQEEVLVSSLKDKFYKTMSSAKSTLTNSAQIYYVNKSRSIRNYTIAGLILATLVVTPLFLITWGFIAAIVAVVSFIFLLIMSQFMIKKNKEGTQILSELKGFKNFIKVAEENKLKMLLKEDPGYFESTMSYALAFGLFDKWASKFDALHLPPPTWYTSSTGRIMTMNHFSHSFTSAIESTKSNMISAPSSSGSGGGGSSGGGFGGGGGGSW